MTTVDRPSIYADRPTMPAPPDKSAILKLAASYARKSTPDAPGISAQHLENSQRALADGYHIPDSSAYLFGDDDTSGVTTSRSEFDRLKALIKEMPPFTRLYVKDRTRFGRWDDPRMHFYFEMDFQIAGVEIVYLDEGVADPNDIGTFFKGAAGNVAAALERNRLLKRVIGGKRHAVSRGCFPGAQVPYGLDRWLADANGALLEVIQPPGTIKRLGCHYRMAWAKDGSAEIVERIFEEAARGVSLRKIADQLNAEGRPSPGMRRRNKLAGPWRGTTVLDILRNPIYKGDFIWGRGKAVIKNLGDVTMEDFRTGIRSTAYLPPLISPELWDLVQTRLDGSQARQTSRRAATPTFLLSGLVVCKHCGAPLHGHTSTQKYEKRRRYYTHPAKTADRPCTTTSLNFRADALEPAVEALVLQLLDDPLIVNQVTDQLDALLQAERTLDTSTSVREHHGEVTRLKAAAVEAGRHVVLAQTTGERETYQAIVAEFTAQADQHEAAIKSLLERERELQDARSRFEKASTTWRAPSAAFREGTPRERIDFLKSLLTAVAVNVDTYEAEVILTTP